MNEPARAVRVGCGKHVGDARRVRRSRCVIALLVAALAFSCGRAPELDVSREPGLPLPDLADAPAGRFLLGKAVFERLVVPEEGLGPLFNSDRCTGCHDSPTAGGGGSIRVTKATRYADGRCDLLEAEGGDNFQQRATPLLMEHGIRGERIPSDATAHATIEAPPLYGAGLIEAIPEDAILERDDPQDADGDGISGRAGRDTAGAMSRFSRKADVATIRGFIDTALRFEVGLTTPEHPFEETVNGRPLPAGVDPMRDPEIDDNGIGLLVDYVRYLAPPARAASSGMAADTVRRGERLFGRLRCDACHTPTLRTGKSDVKSLDRVQANLYSDLLLHEMGEELADICGTNASPSEWRTQPLWGLRHRSRYMHDGRTADLDAAILAHGGEAKTARDAFAALTDPERQDLLRFLASL